MIKMLGTVLRKNVPLSVMNKGHQHAIPALSRHAFPSLFTDASFQCPLAAVINVLGSFSLSGPRQPQKRCLIYMRNNCCFLPSQFLKKIVFRVLWPVSRAPLVACCVYRVIYGLYVGDFFPTVITNLFGFFLSVYYCAVYAWAVEPPSRKASTYNMFAATFFTVW